MKEDLPSHLPFYCQGIP